jgi:beta-lactamase regulating signal transducer with metallopeptidase domain/protocatechuate 3,4-dioxygenase beta subunit
MAWHLVALDLLIHTAVGGSLLLLAAALAVRWCRQPVRRVRLIELALAGAVLLPLTSQLPGLPRWSAGLLPRGAESPTLTPPQSGYPAGPEHSPDLDRSLAFRAGAGAAVAPSEPVVAPPAEQPPAESATAVPPDAPAPIAWQRLVLLGYGGIVTLLLGRALVGFGRLWWLCHKASPAPREVRDLFDDVAGRAGGRTRLLVSDAVEVPLVAAGWRPTILLPGELCRGGDDAALRYSLAHEWSHVENGDVWRWWLATLAQPLFFYQPLFWWLRGQLRLCQDYLADARAAEQADEAEDYAAYLVALARRRLGVPAGALGMGGRRSYLHRRVMMLLQSQRPLERRCFALWTFGAGLAALALLFAVSAVRLDAEAPKAAPKETPKESPKDKPSEKGETLRYSGKVTDKDTGKPIAGATVVVRRSLYGDPEVKENDRIVEESKHKTDAEGKYSFTIPPEQSSKRYLYVELDVEHPDYAPQKRFGYALSMIRKNEKLGGRPFFEHVALRPGKAITGRVLTPEGKPAAGVKVLAYSNTDKRGGGFEYGSFDDARTDAKGDFRVTLITPGPAVFWILPEKYAPSAHGVKSDKRGDLGSFTLAKGVRLRGTVLDAKGKPLAGVHVNAESREPNEEVANLPVADHVGRSATTNAKGEFEMGPLAPGKYRVKPGEHGRDPAKDSKDHPAPRPLPAVFVAQTVALKDGENKPVEVRAVPHVTVEAQYFNSKGEKTRGHDCHVFGRIDNDYWFAPAKADANGKITVNVPHGLEKAELSLSTNEHGVLRWRKAKKEPLNNSRKIDLGTLDDHVKGIEIIRYVAPILVINARGKDGSKIKTFEAKVLYAKGKSPKDPKSFFVNGVQGDVYLEKQEDGRWRSSQLLPDEELTVAASADGYRPGSVKVKLAEGKVKELTLELEKGEPKKDSKAEKKEKE